MGETVGNSGVLFLGHALLPLILKHHVSPVNAQLPIMGDESKL